MLKVLLDGITGIAAPLLSGEVFPLPFPVATRTNGRDTGGGFQERQHALTQILLDYSAPHKPSVLKSEPRAVLLEVRLFAFNDYVRMIDYLPSLSHFSSSSLVSTEECGRLRFSRSFSRSGAYLSAMRLILSQALHSLKNNIISKIAPTTVATKKRVPKVCIFPNYRFPAKLINISHIGVFIGYAL